MDGTSSTHDDRAVAQRPQQFDFSPSIKGGVHAPTVRSIPPSASDNCSYRTPQPRTGRRRPQPQQAQRSAVPMDSFGSPFTSPPPALAHPTEDNRSARSSRSTPQFYHPSMADSPFQSPPSMLRPSRKPDPLVLDPAIPSSNRSHSGHDMYSSSSSAHARYTTTTTTTRTVPTSSQKSSLTSNPATDIASKLLEVATGRIRDQPSHGMGGSSYYHSTPIAETATHDSAASQAHTAIKAGFLQKLGKNIPEFKRRFFLLKAETNLYYFLSPHDKEPRGKFSLEESQLRHVETLPDGRYRFRIELCDQDHTHQHQQQHARKNTVLLEARSEDIGHEWMKLMQSERVSTLNTKVDQLMSKGQSQEQLIADMQRQIEHFRLVEKDRDGALEDARQWKAQFERLDEALRLLTQRLRKPPKLENSKESVVGSNLEPLEEEKKDSDSFVHSEEGNNNVGNALGATPENDSTPTKNNQSSAKKKASTLLDVALHNDDQLDVEEILDVPGTYFFGLANICQQQQERLQLASQEAATAVDDLHEARAQVDAMKKRMTRAEQELTKLWEENCSLRKKMKQTKRDKRVLVREYKALQSVNQELEEAATKSKMHSQNTGYQFPKQTVTEEDEEEKEISAMEDTMICSDEERLIVELEEHVASSIRLHERLIEGTRFLDYTADNEMNTSIDFTEATNDEVRSYDCTAPDTRWPKDPQSPLRPVPPKTKLLSLMDGDESESGSDEEDDVGVNEYQSMSPSIASSVGAEFGSVDEASQRSVDTMPAAVSTDSSPERKNPLLQLDHEEYDEQPNLCSALIQSQSTSSQSVVTASGKATARIECPLSDVVKPRGLWTSTPEANSDMSVYHVTFYSRKIGIQFQKAPPPPTKPKGLLTDALTADLKGDVNGSNKTAAELRNVAAITALASGRTARNEEICPVTLPQDIVLVCGFHGFDESGMNQRPKLGARLVAFDGVSVEIGHWTFDSIRKAIQARGRPLTLSFRNDFLTKEQRAVLTKAVMEVDAKCPPTRPTQYTAFRPVATVPSINSTLSHESDYFVNEKERDNDINQPVPEQDLSAWAQQDDCCHEKIALASNSVSNQYGKLRRMSSGSISTHHSNNFRSFSEAGSSIASNFAPLVANLVKGVSERKRATGEYTPEYLRRADSLENTPQHQDFQSNLL